MAMPECKEKHALTKFTYEVDPPVPSPPFVLRWVQKRKWGHRMDWHRREWEERGLGIRKIRGGFFFAADGSEIEGENKDSKPLVHLAGGQRMYMDMCAGVGCCMAQGWAGHCTSTPCSFTWLNSGLHVSRSQCRVARRCYRRCCFICRQIITNTLMHILRV